MDTDFYLRVLLQFAVYASVYSVEPPEGAYVVECRDGYLLVAADLTFTGIEPVPRFEAVDATGVYPITDQYGSECGYTVSIQIRAELRASYFSCHTSNQNDEVFTFSFILVVPDHDGEAKYTINATCSPSLSWSSREVVCEENYMEVSVRSEGSCPSSGVSTDDWNVALTALGSATSDWQVMFQRVEQQIITMSISEAREQGYVFEVTARKLVFRSPYGQKHSTTEMVHGVPVEVIHPVMLIREGLTLRMVDMVVACTTYASWYDGANLVWETPTLLSPLMSGLSGLKSKGFRMGVNGQLLEQPITAARGYIMDNNNDTVWIGIPLNAAGGYRKSFVMNNTYIELYMVHLYYEHMFMVNDDETRLRLHRPMVTPQLPWPLFTIDQTVLEKRVFTVYLGNIAFDAELVAVKLNGQDFTVLEAIQNGFPITRVTHPNETSAYVIKVPFSDPIVPEKYFLEGFLQYQLDINYTLTILQEEPYYHLATVVAQINNVFPPDFEGICSEGGISFYRDHQPFDYLWEVGVGLDPLTPELAARRRYVMHNDSQSLFLDVPLFTIGYKYEDINLRQFFGSFEILSRDAKTLEIQHSSVKRCLFETTELLVCSTTGEMTVVANVSLAIPRADPARTSLLDTTCKPKEIDDTKVLFAFKLNTCGTRVQVDERYLTYENEILFHRQYSPQEEQPIITRDADYRIIVRCIYPLKSVNRLVVNREGTRGTPGFGFMQTDTPDVPHVIPPVTKPQTIVVTPTPTIKAPIKKSQSVRKSPRVQQSVQYKRIPYRQRLAKPAN